MSLPDLSLHGVIRIIILSIFAIILRWFFFMWWMAASDPLADFPGPDGSYFESHLQQVMDPDFSADTHKDWCARFGKTFRFHGFGRHDLRLMSLDPHVVQQIMTSPQYEKPWQTRSFLSRLIGRGIFSMRGREHSKQRAIIGRAFNHHTVKTMMPVFFRKAEELVERLRIVQQAEELTQKLTVIQSKGKDAQSSGPVPSKEVIDMAHWIARASFDAMGLVGFKYNFNSLQDESEKVYNAYRRMFNIADQGLGFLQILELYIPLMRTLWVTRDIRTTNQCLRIISEAGKSIVKDRRFAYEEARRTRTENKDILSLMIKTNENIQASDRLTDQELFDQCSTFLLAGSDTVSVALAWCFHQLSLNPGIQNRLRREINKTAIITDGYVSEESQDSGFQDSTPESRYEAIDKCRYLDAVVRETLRFNPPVHATIRVATGDSIIRINAPVTMKNGETAGKSIFDNKITVRKGTYVHIPIEGFNYSEDVWGKDATEFNPNRWLDDTENKTAGLGVQDLMTFGTGHTGCLGTRLTFLQMKAFIATLLPRFEFLPVDGVQIGKFNTILTRPYVVGKWSEGTQLPLRVSEIT